MKVTTIEGQAQLINSNSWPWPSGGTNW